MLESAEHRDLALELKNRFLNIFRSYRRAGIVSVADLADLAS